MDNDFYFEETNPKKVRLSVIIIIIIFLIIAGILLFVRSRLTLSVKKVVEYEAGDKLSYNLEDYLYNDIKNSKDYKITFSAFLTSTEVLDTVGEYEYKVSYKGISKRGKIKVVDTKAPVVEVEKLIVGVDEDLIISDGITKCDDYSRPCQVEFVKESDADITKKAGNYKVDVTITDAYGNKVKKTIEVEVRNNYNSVEEKENDLGAHHVDPGYDDWEGQYLIKFSKAYNNDHLEGIEEFDAISEVMEGDMHRYLDPMYANNRIDVIELVNIYNKYNYVIGVTYYLKLDNGKHFYITK